MPTRAKSNKRQYERDYPFKVELPERPEGYGMQLNEILAWCGEHCGDWKVFGRRFYFKTEDDAGRFERTWLE